MVRILGEPMREARRKSMLAIEDEITADQEDNTPLAIQNIVQNNPEENEAPEGTEVPAPAISDMIENNAEDTGVPPQDSSSSSSSSSESESTPPLPAYQQVLQWESDWADTYNTAVWLGEAAGENPKRRKLAHQLLVRIMQYKAKWEST